METEAISIDEYLGSDDRKKFDFLFGNFSVLKPMIKNYREELISDIADMKECNRRAKNGDLGVRIHVSMRRDGPTERKAINNLTIEKAIDEGYLDEDFFEDTDNHDEIIRRVTLYHSVNADYETFRVKLDTMTPGDQKVLRPYLMREKSMNDLANEMGIEYRSAVMRMYRIRKRLCDKVETRLLKGRV